MARRKHAPQPQPQPARVIPQTSLGPYRAVVSGRRGGNRHIDVLECGHEVPTRRHQGGARKRRCYPCLVGQYTARVEAITGAKL